MANFCTLTDNKLLYISCIVLVTLYCLYCIALYCTVRLAAMLGNGPQEKKSNRVQQYIKRNNRRTDTGNTIMFHTEIIMSIDSEWQQASYYHSLRTAGTSLPCEWPNLT